MKTIVILLALVLSFTLGAEMSSDGKRALCLSFVVGDSTPCSNYMLDTREQLLCEAFAMDRISELDRVDRYCELIKNAPVHSSLSASKKVELQRKGMDLYGFCRGYRYVIGRDYSSAASACSKITDRDQRFRCQAVVLQIGIDMRLYYALLQDQSAPVRYCLEKIDDDELSRSCLSMVNHQKLGYEASVLDQETIGIIHLEVNKSRCDSIRMR